MKSNTLPRHIERDVRRRNKHLKVCGGGLSEARGEVAAVAVVEWGVYLDGFALGDLFDLEFIVVWRLCQPEVPRPIVNALRS